MKFFLGIFLIPLALAACPSGTVYNAAFNKCYKFGTDKLAFFLAEQSCTSIGGHLTSIMNGFENSLVAESAASSFSNQKDFWIGANLLMSTNWSWTDGTNFTYSNWAAGALNNNTNKCASVLTKGSQWTPVDCGMPKPYVCEIPGSAPPPTAAPCPTPAPHPGYCASGWTYFDYTDSCYRTELTDNFDNAENSCVASGAHLASIHSRKENDFVCGLAGTGLTLKWDQQAWIGLRKISGSWKWTDGTKVDFFNWDVGQPDNASGEESCAQILPDNLDEKHESGARLTWNDIKCTDTMRALVCKKPAMH